MKKLINLTIAATAALTLSTSLYADNHMMDEKAMCDIKANGIEKVIATAKKYNEIAKEKGLEFRRLNVNNSDLIISVEEAIKTGAKEVNPKTFKGKKSKTVLETNYAAVRACKFAIAALNQAEEGKKTWRLAVPGDGYKY
ncbi:hypothetical protein [Arcobacter arenosus]|uniref:Uncharacterized protein n=1 Tax=Arcobacter arenosus TaxID=2576037 RepID=A0A5R8XYB4_9BACT|nr:hypothetical protein [Arcobacter arenosus]TLP36320.1 hypothetical protein FDK22_13730 [Arcobacter arenosus]